MAMVSSSRVQTSVIRISSVGKRAEGRRSHQILVASSISPTLTRVSTVRWILVGAREGRRQAGARHLVPHRQAIGVEPGLVAAPEGRGGRQRQQVRQEIGQLVEQVEAERLVLDADMDVHAADQEPPGHHLEVAGERVVALLVGVALQAPLGEGVGRGGDRREAVAVGAGGHGARAGGRARPAPRPASRRPRCRSRPGSAGTPRSPAAPSAASRSAASAGRRIGGEIAGLAVDEEVFLLDADGEGWLGRRHRRKRVRKRRDRPMSFVGGGRRCRASRGDAPTCHARESGESSPRAGCPCRPAARPFPDAAWVPAFAGMSVLGQRFVLQDTLYRQDTLHRRREQISGCRLMAGSWSRAGARGGGGCF